MMPAGNNKRSMRNGVRLPARWHAWWNRLAEREQNLLRMTAILVCLALVWWMGLAPAVRSLRTAESRHASVDRQLQQMQALRAEAERLRNQPRAPVVDARQLLQSTLTQELGNTAQLNWLAGRAQISLKAAPAPALARWLAQVRSNTHAMPVEMTLTTSRTSAADANATATVAAKVQFWDGTLVLDWPGADAAQP